MPSRQRSGDGGWRATRGKLRGTHSDSWLCRCRYPSSPPPVSSFLSRDLEPSRRSQLMLSRDLLDKPWAATRLSIIGPHGGFAHIPEHASSADCLLASSLAADRETYCFSKAYSRIVDRSAGSCLLEDAAGKQPTHRPCRIFLRSGRIALLSSGGLTA